MQSWNSGLVNRQQIACVVLAAGRGTRFGEPKVTAEVVAGTTFLDAIVGIASSAGIECIVAVVPANVSVNTSVRCVVNPDAAAQQIDSARLGIAALEDDVEGALLWPVDHPFVRGETIRAILETAGSTSSPAAVPMHDGRRGHPVFFSRDAWPLLFRATDGGARSVLRALGSAVLEVPVADEGCIADIDTRADLERWMGSNVG